MSAVSNSVIPASSAAWTSYAASTAVRPSSASRHMPHAIGDAANDEDPSVREMGGIGSKAWGKRLMESS
jgi:hypothetical protein